MRSTRSRQKERGLKKEARKKIGNEQTAGSGPQGKPRQETPRHVPDTGAGEVNLGKKKKGVPEEVMATRTGGKYRVSWTEG